MANWIPAITTLSGEIVSLLPIGEKHFSELEKLSKEKRIWEHYIYDGSDPDTFQWFLDYSLEEREKGNHFPFVIIENQTNKLIGSTRFMDIQPKHKKLEIGTTWLHPDYWGTAINLECKLLLLTFCFETLGTQRVQLKTDEKNVRSRKAIEKIGGEFEGIVRNDMLRQNGTKRDSALYSITDREWNEKKSKLTMLLQERKKSLP